MPTLAALLRDGRRTGQWGWGWLVDGSVWGVARSGVSAQTWVMADNPTLTAVFTPDEDGWTMAQLAEWPAVVTCGRTVEEAREMLLDCYSRAARFVPR